MKLSTLLIEATACSTWADKSFVQGDGVNTPKITISKTPTLVTGTYEGPEKGFCIQSAIGSKGDSVHQLATITVFHECNPYLKELYKQGTFVRPNMKKITMERSQNYFKISIPLINTTEDKAITSINERGSWGGGEANTDKKELNDARTRPMFDMVPVTADDIFEIFFCWRNLEKYPIKTKTKPSSETKPVEKSKEAVKPAEKPKEEPKQKEAPKSQLVVNQTNGTYETPGKRFFLMYGKDSVLAEVGKTTDNDMQLKYVKIDGSKANIFGSFKYNKDKTAVVQVNDDGTLGQEFKILKF